MEEILKEILAELKVSNYLRVSTLAMNWGANDVVDTLEAIREGFR